MEVQIPIFSTLEITPTSSLALVVFSSNDDVLSLNQNNFLNYASKIKADYQIIKSEDKTYPDIYKFKASQYLDFYERIILINCDSIIDPKCPNLFDYVNTNEIGVFDEVNGYGLSRDDQNSVYSLELAQELSPFNFKSFFSTSLIVASKEHKQIFDLPKKTFNSENIADKFFLNYNIIKNNFKIYYLPEEFQWLLRNDKNENNQMKYFIYNYQDYSELVIENKIQLIKSKVEDCNHQSYIEIMDKITQLENPGMSRVINEKDPFYSGSINAYLKVGKSFIRFLRLVQSISRKENFAKTLDFNSNFGRITRWIKSEFPESDNHIFEKNQEAANFCLSELKVLQVNTESLQNSTDLGVREFDLIFCNCYLTGVSEANWGSLIRTFQEALTDKGILLISSHGRMTYDLIFNHVNFNKPIFYSLTMEQCDDVLRQLREVGFSYLGAEFGFSVAFPEWVFACVNAVAPKLNCIHFEQSSLDDHLDLYAFQKNA